MKTALEKEISRLTPFMLSLLRHMQRGGDLFSDADRRVARILERRGFVECSRYKDEFGAYWWHGTLTPDGLLALKNRATGRRPVGARP